MSANIILCETGYYRSSCVECQRRKQKCNREWPCDSCRRRKVPDGCRYNDPHPSADAASAAKAQRPALPREKRPSRNGADDNDRNAGFEALAERAFASMGINESVKSDQFVSRQDLVQPNSSAQLEKIIGMLPKRPMMDILVQLFLTDVNYHYYIIYPPSFLQEYHIWWDKRAQDKPISLQFTTLLAILLSCTTQHLDATTRETLKKDISQDSDKYSEDLHTAVREVASVIPAGHYDLCNVQRLLHSCYWYKAEARFVEAWHVLNQAVMEARELELYKEPAEGTMSDFDLEMRRRVWCILETWDWQISSGLSRPKLIDRAAVSTRLPDLTLEGYNPHPMMHMKMQAGLTRELAARFNSPKNIVSPEDINEYKDMIIAWVGRFPTEYDFYNPDTSRDDVHPWIFPHRFYVYTMACLLILNPIRNYMVQAYTWDSPKEDIEVRNIGVFYSLVLIQTLRRWVDRISDRDGRLHFIIFSIFDTSAMLCTAVLKDQAKTLPRRGEILESITRSIGMLRKLMSISGTAKMSHDILYRLSKKVTDVSGSPLVGGSSKEDRRKRTKPNRPSTAAPGASKSPTPATEAVAPNPAENVPSDGAPMAMPMPEPALMAQTMTNPIVEHTAPQTQPQPSQQAHLPVQPPAQMPMQPQAHTQYNTGAYATNVSALPPNYAMPNGYMPPNSTMPSGNMPLGAAPVQRSPPATANGQQAGNITPGAVLVPEAFSSHLTGGLPAVATFWDAPTPPGMSQQQMAPVTQVGNGGGYPFPGSGMNDMGGQPMQQPVSAPMYVFPPPPPEEPVQELNLAALTETQLGGLAPLWSWHASNIDFSVMGNEENVQHRM